MTLISRRTAVAAGGSVVAGMLCASPAAALVREAGRPGTGVPDGLLSVARGYTAQALGTTATGTGGLACLAASGGGALLAASHGSAAVASAEELAAHLSGPAVSFVTVPPPGGGSPVVDAAGAGVARATPAVFSGPLRDEDPRVGAVAAPAGTLDNGALAATSWGTLLCAEEGGAANFGSRQAGWRGNEAQWRYGVQAVGSARSAGSAGSAGSADWSALDARFDVGLDDRLPHRFGWVLEHAVADGGRRGAPVKRTALGRMRHSGLAVAESRGRAVVYTGDGEHGEYLYKFVSRGAAGEPLDDGVLHVARLGDDGRGRWLPLTHGRGPLTSSNGWRDQADVLLRTRLAADAVGATPLPTPGRIAADARRGELLCVLDARSAPAGCAAVGPARSRATGAVVATPPGNVLRLREDGGDPAATGFRWSGAWLSGQGLRAEAPVDRPPAAQPAVRDLQFDARGSLWAVLADDQDGEVGGELLVVDVATGDGERVASARPEARFTAAAVAQDGRQVFVAVRSPEDERGATLLSVHRPDERPVIATAA
ncbi:PhoX family protein [Streptomyces hainanensis]|uniref:DUF839 domain-containing protein n=1 Tax=Streptomyces hainanensis TaxID=402648 RepID=A0A4V2Y3X2_9ACTN|nr:alkaline phosphatase PhoX [Streptomyces hainanensis]TDC78115.1 DUF839 domain-containing protein [Streptomyces hainanensis]